MPTQLSDNFSILSSVSDNSIHYTVSQCRNARKIHLDYPESQPAIDDLKLCLQKIDLRHRLNKSLKTALETRLLHPGVNTTDILSGYIAAIKAIRHLDSKGVLLESITELVKKYMKNRSDTVRFVHSVSIIPFAPSLLVAGKGLGKILFHIILNVYH